LICKVIGQNTKDDMPTKTVYNTIETPKGGQYRIDLPDGTMVWLNAGSSLRYPNRFAGQERKVALTGEAYFEVAKNKQMPFRVVSGKQVVEVLGTHFNINAYTDEASVKTTLLEGSVNVLLQETHQSELLNPGQQAVVKYNGSSIVVQPVKVEEAVAWKNGYFMFVDADLESIMRQLARWYDVEVAYEGNLGSLKFGGMVSRSKSIAQTLRILELTGNVRFKVAGRRVTVMP
jgi:transmembrane sensor